MMEEALAFGQLDLSRYDMLPKLALSAGYSSRNNNYVSDSRDVNTNALLLSNATSQDRNHSTYDLAATWNILDFGVSYFQAHQQADRALIMQERRRKTVQLLMQQVRQAYWQAVGAQELETKVDPLLKLVSEALADTEKVQQEKLRPPLEVLNYQKSLLDLIRQLEAIRDELGQAKPRLAALMNTPPGTPFHLKVPASLSMPVVKQNLAQMEDEALMQRPDIAEATLQERISANEVKKAIARLLPGLELNFGPHHDSNSFLHNHNWTEGGLRVTWNLLNLLSGPVQKKVAEDQVEVVKTQRLALEMAVLAQVQVSWRDFSGKKRQYELAQRLFDIDRQINQQTATGAANDAQSKLAAIRAGASELMADYRRYQNYAALQSSYGQLIATLGMDPLPATVASQDVGGLAKAIAAHTPTPTQAAPAVAPVPTSAATEAKPMPVAKRSDVPAQGKSGAFLKVAPELMVPEAAASIRNVGA
jgi:outer membrane protein TolC